MHNRGVLVWKSHREESGFELRDPTSPSFPLLADIDFDIPERTLPDPLIDLDHGKPPPHSISQLSDRLFGFSATDMMTVVDLEHDPPSVHCVCLSGTYDIVGSNGTAQKDHVRGFWRVLPAGNESFPRIASFSSALSLWDRTDGSFVAATRARTGYAYFDIGTLPWRQWIVFGGYNTFELYDGVSLRLLHARAGRHSENLLAFGVNPLTRTFICTGDGGTTIWDASGDEIGEKPSKVDDLDFEGCHVLIAPELHLFLLVGDRGGEIHVYDDRMIVEEPVFKKTTPSDSEISYAGDGLVICRSSLKLSSMRVSDLHPVASVELPSSSKEWGPFCAYRADDLTTIPAKELAEQELERVEFAFEHEMSILSHIVIMTSSGDPGRVLKVIMCLLRQ